MGKSSSSSDSSDYEWKHLPKHQKKQMKKWKKKMRKGKIPYGTPPPFAIQGYAGPHFSGKKHGKHGHVVTTYTTPGYAPRGPAVGGYAPQPGYAPPPAGYAVPPAGGYAVPPQGQVYPPGGYAPPAGGYAAPQHAGGYAPQPAGYAQQPQAGYNPGGFSNQPGYPGQPPHGPVYPAGQMEDCEPYDPEATVEESSDEDEAIKRADDGAEVHEEDKEDKASDADDEAEEEEKKEKEKEEEKDKEEEEKDKEEEEKKEEDDEEKEKDEDKEKHKDKKHDESEGTVTLDGNAEEFTPTVVDADDFSAEKDAGVLSEAMQGFGTNEHMMVDIVGRRSRKQRNEISVTYKTMFGKDLIEDLDSELSGDLQELILGLFKPADYYDAWCLREAMKGPGTKDHILIEILCTRTNDQIAAMVNAYKENFSADLEQDIHDDTSGEFKQLMVSCCQGARTELSSEQLDEVRSDGWEKVVDRDQATEDAQRLFEAGENRWGTDESVFLQILALRNYYQLRGIFEEYEKIAGCDIIESISGEMSGNFEDGLKALVKSARNRPEYFADKLHDALSGVGTKDTSLIRIIISRSEIDLKDIQEIFQVKYQQALATMIDSDTSGDYKQLLLTIVGK